MFTVFAMLTLCMQDGLKGVSDFAVKLKNIISFMRDNDPRKQIFKRLCSDINLKPKVNISYVE